MDFKRKKKRGVSQRTRKIWLSKEGYRITWRCEVCGVQVPSAYQACVRTIVSSDSRDVTNLQIMWDFVNNSKRLHRTMNAAVKECEAHHQLWTKAVQCTGIRALCELLGQFPSCVPRWATEQLSRRMLIALTDTTPHRGQHSEKEEEEPAVEPEKLKKRKVRSDKGKTRKTRKKATSTLAKPKRRTRSDKGKPRGPRKPKGTI